MLNHLTLRKFALWVLLMCLFLFLLLIPSVWIAASTGLFAWLSVYVSVPKPKAPDSELPRKTFWFLLVMGVVSAAISVHQVYYVSDRAHSNMKHLFNKYGFIVFWWSYILTIRYFEWRKANSPPVNTDSATIIT